MLVLQFYVIVITIPSKGHLDFPLQASSTVVLMVKAWTMPMLSMRSWSWWPSMSWQACYYNCTVMFQCVGRRLCDCMGGSAALHWPSLLGCRHVRGQMLMQRCDVLMQDKPKVLMLAVTDTKAELNMTHTCPSYCHNRVKHARLKCTDGLGKAVRMVRHESTWTPWHLWLPAQAYCCVLCKTLLDDKGSIGGSSPYDNKL